MKWNIVTMTFHHENPKTEETKKNITYKAVYIKELINENLYWAFPLNSPLP